MKDDSPDALLLASIIVPMAMVVVQIISPLLRRVHRSFHGLRRVQRAKEMVKEHTKKSRVKKLAERNKCPYGAGHSEQLDSLSRLQAKLIMAELQGNYRDEQFRERFAELHQWWSDMRCNAEHDAPTKDILDRVRLSPRHF